MRKHVPLCQRMLAFYEIEVVAPATPLSLIICLIFFSTVTVVLGQYSLALSQVTTITPTTGGGNLRTTVTSEGNTVQITGGARPNNGPNLFHSFQEFSVAHPDTAQFLNTTPQLTTSNILARVTGGLPSNIFGSIDTLTFPIANLFLMNPAGIVFGPNAALNVAGSVNFTTADYLTLMDGNVFHAIPNAVADAILSAAPVAAFGFLGSNPGAISVEGAQLSVRRGQDITLVGGNITVQGAHLSASGGRVNMASVASPGEVEAGRLVPGANADGVSFWDLGSVRVSELSVIDASGDGGGTVRIRGARLVVDDSTISANTTGPTASTSVVTAGEGVDIHMSETAVIQNGSVLETNVSENVAEFGSGGVRIKADRIEMLGTVDFENEIFLLPAMRSNVAENSSGSSGNISLEAQSLLTSFGILETLTSGGGNAGDVIMRAVGSIDIEAATIVSFSEFASGSSGNIEFTSMEGNILMGLSFVTTQTFESSGNAGSILIRAPHGDVALNEFTDVFNATRGTGAIGEIQIAGQSLTLNGFSGIAGDNVTTVPPQGDITIDLSENLVLSGESRIQTTSRGPAPAAGLRIAAQDILITEGSFLSTEALFINSADGGIVNIAADGVRLTDGGQIRTGTAGVGSGGTVVVEGLNGPARSVVIDGTGSGIFTDTTGTGRGGIINLASQAVMLQNGGSLSASTSGPAATAMGGNVSIAASDGVKLSNQASITAGSTGPADAGDIFVNAGKTFQMHDSFVTTEAQQASGGNTTIVAQDVAQLSNSVISTSVQGGPETAGGNIDIDPEFVILQNSKILAQAVQGQGGNITITTNVFMTDSNSVVNASSQFGRSGEVTIQSPLSNLSASWVRLQQSYLEAAALLRQACAARLAAGKSSLILTGRDRIPMEPGSWLSSPIALQGISGGGPVALAQASPAFDGETVSVRRYGISPVFYDITNAGCPS